jgi:hypothetical protein
VAAAVHVSTPSDQPDELTIPRRRIDDGAKINGGGRACLPMAPTPARTKAGDFGTFPKGRI